MGTGDQATIPEAEAGPSDRHVCATTIGLVVIWCPFDVEKVGAWLPATKTPKIFGRGPAQATDPHPRVAVVRQRPGDNVALGSFESPSISRIQLELVVREARLWIKNLGQCRLLVNGVAVDNARLEAGDVAELGSQVAFVCVERPVRLSGVVARLGEFGVADGYGLVGETPSVWRLREELAFAATRSGHVLIQGESGTGKELAATAIHSLSGRRGALISRNAATFPETLIDAELFGNAKGYPNVGMPERKGLIGAADGGSLFLDEFAELPLAQQAHLLRVLDAGEYQRLGETQARRAEFRLIAATNRADSALREDVLARFGFRIRLPRLAQRREDIPLLVRHMLQVMTDGDAELRERYFDAQGGPRLGISLVRALVQAPPRANIRELRNILWAALQRSSGDTLEWPGAVHALAIEADPEDADAKKKLQEALDVHGGSLEKTWRALGMTNRFALIRLMKKYDVQVRKRATGD